MIKDSQKTEITPYESFPPSPKHTLRPRPLHAIEIAEGALLADIGVILQLLIKFLPVIGSGLLILIPVIFAVIVLRRGFYVGCMSLCVALFVVCIVLGPGGTPLFLLAAGAGLFLGLTMRHRLNPLVTCIIGVLGGGAALWLVLLLYTFVGGGAGVLVRGLHEGYTSTTTLIGVLLRPVGLDGFWLSSILPALNVFMQWGFQHWLFLYYLLTCVTCIPVVPCIYFVVNFFLRMLGYQVSPFPGYRLEGWFLILAGWLLTLVGWFVTLVSQSLTLVRWLLWFASGRRSTLRPGLVRSPTLRPLKRELRRLNIARLHQQRLKKEAHGKV
jgi:hypothetical protein